MSRASPLALPTIDLKIAAEIQADLLASAHEKRFDRAQYLAAKAAYFILDYFLLAEADRPMERRPRDLAVALSYLPDDTPGLTRTPKKHQLDVHELAQGIIAAQSQNYPLLFRVAAQ